MITGLKQHPTIVRSILASSSSLKELNLLPAVGEKSTEEEVQDFKTRFYEANKKLVGETLRQGKSRIEGIWAGDYELPAMPISSMKVSQLPWHNFSGMTYALAGCGNLVLGQITGANPWEINSLMRGFMKEFCARPGNEHLNTKEVLAGGYVPAEFMMTFFMMHGIHMYPLTVRDVCPVRRLIENHVTHNHVVLVALHVAAQEQTWAIIFQNKLWHGTEVQPLHPLEFINNPIAESYLLFNPAWKTNSARINRLMELEDSPTLDAELSADS